MIKYSREGIEATIPNSLSVDDWPSLLFYNLPKDSNTISTATAATLKVLEMAREQQILVMLGT